MQRKRWERIRYEKLTANKFFKKVKKKPPYKLFIKWLFFLDSRGRYIDYVSVLYRAAIFWHHMEGIIRCVCFLFGHRNIFMHCIDSHLHCAYSTSPKKIFAALVKNSICIFYISLYEKISFLIPFNKFRTKNRNLRTL